jgi:hypothetical protein
VTHAKPRTAVTYFNDSVAADTRPLLARYQLVILGMTAWKTRGTNPAQEHVSGIKALNPSIIIAPYVKMTELEDPTYTNDPIYPLWQSVNANDWWLRNAAGGRIAGYPGNYNMNSTAWTRQDANGDRFPQARAKWDTANLLSKMQGINYVFIDGVVPNPLIDADYRGIDTNQSKTDPTIIAAFRKGFVDYLNTIRALNPGLKMLPSSLDLSVPEYKGQYEGQYRECLMGKSWSHEDRLGWTAMMQDYRAALANTKAPKTVVLGACTENGTNPATYPAHYRYGLASTLLEDGYYSWADRAHQGYRGLPWFDESGAPLGTAAEAPPTAPTASGIWLRRYTNGMVLVNPSKTTAASIDVGPGYKHILGTIDPVVNNGQPARIVTLQPRSGLVLIKQ